MDPLLEERLKKIERKLDLILREEKKKHPEEEWIHEKEAAALFNWEPRTLRKRAKAGMVPVQYKSVQGRNYRYNRSQLLRFLNL